MVQAMTKVITESKTESMSKPLNQGDTANKPKILVTGATGFIGQAFCRSLVGRGFDVQILLRDPADFSKIPLGLGAGMVVGALENETSLAVACAGREQIIHLAGLAHVGGGWTKPAMETNLLGPQNLLAAALKADVRRIVFLSSSLAEASSKGVGDVTTYGASKLQAERLFRDAALAGQIEVAILRAVNVYGLGMNGNIARMISLISRGALPPLPKIENRISLLSVQDLCQALLLALESHKSIEDPITVTDGQEYSVADIEQGIYDALGRSKPRWRTPHMILYCASMLAGLASKLSGGRGSISSRTYRNLVSDNVFSNHKAISELGFEPSTTFYLCLPEIVASIRESSR
jgi:UDP-glucose 4-epimerase